MGGVGTLVGSGAVQLNAHKIITMKRAVVIGVTHEGRTELISGVDLYSKSLESAIPARQCAKFAEVWVAEPVKRYRLKSPEAALLETPLEKPFRKKGA